jgi:hypothetical protein
MERPTNPANLTASLTEVRDHTEEIFAWLENFSAEALSAKIRLALLDKGVPYEKATGVTEKLRGALNRAYTGNLETRLAARHGLSLVEEMLGYIADAKILHAENDFEI